MKIEIIKVNASVFVKKQKKKKKKKKEGSRIWKMKDFPKSNE